MALLFDAIAAGVQNDCLRREIASLSTFWGNIHVAGYGKYPGFMIGPEAGDRSWMEPLRKFIRTATLWSQSALGLQFSIVAYSVYVLPILGFVAQLSAPPEEALQLESKALRIMVLVHLNGL